MEQIKHAVVTAVVAVVAAVVLFLRNRIIIMRSDCSGAQFLSERNRKVVLTDRNQYDESE